MNNFSGVAAIVQGVADFQRIRELKINSRKGRRRMYIQSMASREVARRTAERMAAWERGENPKD